MSIIEWHLVSASVSCHVVSGPVPLVRWKLLKTLSLLQMVPVPEEALSTGEGEDTSPTLSVSTQ